MLFSLLGLQKIFIGSVVISCFAVNYQPALFSILSIAGEQKQLP